MNLADNLKRIRKDNNLSQEQLAEKLGVSRQAVSKWESGQSYPEMDKVLQICQLFNLNVNELINEDLREVNEKKEVKNTTNKYISSFFDYITKVVDMLSSMKLKQVILCLMEQLLIAMLLLFVFMGIGGIGAGLISNMLSFLPNSVYLLLFHILETIYGILALIVGGAIFFHIFKIRYLDYYEIVREPAMKDEANLEDGSDNKDDDSNRYDEGNDGVEGNRKVSDNIDKNLITNGEDVSGTQNEVGKKKIYLEKKKEKIIIRDPRHSEFTFLNGLGKVMLWGFKGMMSFVLMMLAFALIMFMMFFVLAFAIVKTGLLFYGTIILLMGGIVITVIALEVVYNFIVSRKCNKSKIFIASLVSFILIGLGSGLSIISIKDFEYEEVELELVRDTYTYDMNDKMIINYGPYIYHAVEYVEKDIANVEIVAEHAKYMNSRVDNVADIVDVYLYSNSSENINMFRRAIDSLNDKKIVNYVDESKVYVYANKENLNRIRQNTNDYYNEVSNLQKRVSDLTSKNVLYEVNNRELMDYLLGEENIKITYDRNGYIVNIYKDVESNDESVIEDVE